MEHAPDANWEPEEEKQPSEMEDIFQEDNNQDVPSKEDKKKVPFVEIKHSKDKDQERDADTKKNEEDGYKYIPEDLSKRKGKLYKALYHNIPNYVNPKEETNIDVNKSTTDKAPKGDCYIMKQYSC